MADVGAHTHAVVLVCESPWEKYGDVTKLWSMKFALSGEPLTDTAAIEALFIALWDCIYGLTSSQTYLVTARYYQPGATVNYHQKEYPYGSGTYHGDWSYWAGTPTDGNQLEVCALAYVLMGNNSKGRSYYLRKFIHDVPQGSLRSSNPGISTEFEADFQALGTGFGANDYIVVDPKTGNAPSGTWQIRGANYTRQLRRAPKKGS